MSWWWRKLLGKNPKKKAQPVVPDYTKQIEAAKKLRIETRRRLTTPSPSYSSSYREHTTDVADTLITAAAVGILIDAASSSGNDSSTTWSPSDTSSSSDSWSGGGGDSGGGGSSGDW